MITAIIVSNAKDERLIKMTQTAVDSCWCDEVIVIEQQKVKYNNCIIIQNTDTTFNYNRALNKGIEQAKGDYIALCNNDIYFYPNFAAIEQVMRTNGVHSASPFTLNQKMIIKAGNYMVDGYRIGSELLGWCIVLDRFALDSIGKLDETYNFWYSDNAYAEQIKKHNIKHYLVCNIFIDHLESVTLKKMDMATQRAMTANEAKKWEKRTRV